MAKKKIEKETSVADVKKKPAMTQEQQAAYDAAVDEIKISLRHMRKALEILEEVPSHHASLSKLSMQITRKFNSLYKFWYNRSPDVKADRDVKKKKRQIERKKKQIAELEAALENEG